MRLDVGSGHRPHKGYKTIEIQEEFHPDYLGDFRTMEFHDIEVIRAHHLLEHFGRDAADKILRQWHDWLKVGGILIIETPDFEGICRLFLETHNKKVKWWCVRHAYGSQEQDAPWSNHINGWYEEKFRDYLPTLGFEVEEVLHDTVHGYLPNVTVRAKKIQ